MKWKSFLNLWFLSLICFVSNSTLANECETSLRNLNRLPLRPEIASLFEINDLEIYLQNGQPQIRHLRYPKLSFESDLTPSATAFGGRVLDILYLHPKKKKNPAIVVRNEKSRQIEFAAYPFGSLETNDRLLYDRVHKENSGLLQP